MDVLRGLHMPAWLVGIARGIVEAAVFAGLYAGADAIAAGALPDEAAWSGAVLLWGIRSLEGVADAIDPAKRRARVE